jgi:hypothetical protein
MNVAEVLGKVAGALGQATQIVETVESLRQRASQTPNGTTALELRMQAVEMLLDHLQSLVAATAAPVVPVKAPAKKKAAKKKAKKSGKAK